MKPLIHLTLCGVEAGRPLCDCDRSNQPSGTRYWHAVYAPLERFRHTGHEGAEICQDCLKIWDDSANDNDSETKET
jgi:hypothetical protein